MFVLLSWLLLASPSVIAVKDLKAGDQGECLTVFEGHAIESFPFIVKGLMEDFLGPHEPVVLVKLLGEKATYTGVVAGMSGSPCSVNHKLVGALSYAIGNFAKEPIAAITPMASMQQLLTLPEEKRPFRLPERQAAWSAFRRGEKAASPGDPADLRPIGTPLTITGIAPSVQQFFAAYLQSQGFVPTAGSGRSLQTVPARFAPGAAIAALLVQGDVQMASTGTVTWVEGNNVLAFGHPFLGSGAVSIPLASAEILNTLVSVQRSFKMAAVGEVAGELTQDRMVGVSGKIGQRVRMVPVSGEVQAGGKTASFQFQVARDPKGTPRFMAMALAGALTGRVEMSFRGMARMRAEIRLPQQPPVVINNVYAAEYSPTLFVDAAMDVAEPFALLWDNPFGPLPDVAVRVHIDVEPEPYEEWIESIHLDRVIARVGDTVDVVVGLRQSQGELHVINFRVPIPAVWAGGEVQWHAVAWDKAERLQRDIRGEVDLRDLQDVMHLVRRRYSDGFVYLLGIRKGGGITARTTPLSFLPPTMVATLSTTNDNKRGRGIAFSEKRERPGIIHGAATITLDIEKY